MTQTKYAATLVQPASSQIGKPGVNQDARWLHVTVQYAADDFPRRNCPSPKDWRLWAHAAYMGAGEMTLRLVARTEAQTLNTQWRGDAKPTNVLSFPYEQNPLVGDLVVCPQVVWQESRQQGKTFTAHCAHMVVHGILHLQGWDHQFDEEAEVMEARERDILATLGFPDPYA